MNPFGRRLFQLPHEITESMGRLEANKQMDVIFDSSKSLGDSIQTSNGASDVLMKPVDPSIGDPWFAKFSAECDVVVEAGEC
jgi:hypothetical protein